MLIAYHGPKVAWDQGPWLSASKDRVGNDVGSRILCVDKGPPTQSPLASRAAVAGQGAFVIYAPQPF
jgi:hypothetical protein